MSRYLFLSLYDDEQMEVIMAALSSKSRRSILRLVSEEKCSVSEIAQKLNMPLSNAAFHVKHLQDADLIHVQERPAAHGVTKIVSSKLDGVSIKCIQWPDISPTSINEFEIPVGSYTDCKVVPSCGIATAESVLGIDDTPGMFYSIDRRDAEIVWFADGYLEYRVPNYYLDNEEALELSFSMEICSEAPNHRQEYPSDITFWINGQELCTWTSPGDFGGRRGRLNPEWWPEISTQYGMLKTIQINERGVYMDGTRMSELKIKELHLEEGDYFTLRIGIKPDAENVGGINLFGEKFGDYGQAIDVRIEHRMKREEKEDGK